MTITAPIRGWAHIGLNKYGILIFQRVLAASLAISILTTSGSLACLPHLYLWTSPFPIDSIMLSISPFLLLSTYIQRWYLENYRIEVKDRNVIKEFCFSAFLCQKLSFPDLLLLLTCGVIAPFFSLKHPVTHALYMYIYIPLPCTQSWIPRLYVHNCRR